MRNVVGVEREVISGARERLLGYPKYFCALSHVKLERDILLPSRIEWPGSSLSFPRET